MLQRDKHLFGPGPKRILSLDGGGVRGALTVAFLQKLEKRLDDKLGHDVRLADHFDLIGGTSTGAIIAGALALGLRTEAIKEFYLKLAPRVFKRPFWRPMVVQSKFDAHELKREIDAVLGARTLGSEDLLTGFALVAKRMDTASPWIISNNPRAPYWSTPSDKKFIGNEHFLLANLVRASTAAPHYFDPEHLPIVDGEAKGLFVDGGVTPHNNPSFALMTLALATAFGLNWTTGPENLTIISVGTGDYRDGLTAASAARMRTWGLGFGLAIKALSGLIKDSQRSTLALMQWLGECPYPWVINSEIGTLADEFLAREPLFRFFRFDAVLDQRWLAETLDLKLTEQAVRRLWHMDDPGIVGEIYEIGLAAAEKQITDTVFG